MTTNLTHCPICGFHKFKKHERDSVRNVYFFECERCGEFEASWELIRGFQDIEKRISKVGYILSGLARELYETEDKPPLFMVKNIDDIIKHHLVPNTNRIEEKIQKLLQRLREKTEFFGQEVGLGDVETLVPLAYAKNSAELLALFTLMTEKKLAKIGVTTNGEMRTVKIALSANGWDVTNSLEKENKESDRGFIAIWFDDSMNESIDAIGEAITECGFRSICIRDEHFSEKIMDKALGEIRKSRFVVVDLTGERGSVFFEAGFAHGLGIETIYVYKEQDVKERTLLEFYVRHYQCYKYKTQTDLKEVLKNAIGARIKLSK